MEAEIIADAKNLIVQSKEHIRTGMNQWSTNSAISRLEYSLKKLPDSDGKYRVEEAWMRLVVFFLSLFAVLLGISGIIFQNKFGGFAFFIVSAGVVMAARKVKFLSILE